MQYIPPDIDTKTVLDDIYGERQYQIGKGYDSKHDDDLPEDYLRGMAISVTSNKDRHSLVKAAGLLVAEIERIDREVSVLKAKS